MKGEKTDAAWQKKKETKQRSGLLRTQIFISVYLVFSLFSAGPALSKVSYFVLWIRISRR